MVLSARQEQKVQLCKEFEKAYGFRPSVVSVAPGRLNLIGEHTDHQNYDVLPLCIEGHITILGGVDTTSKDVLELKHLDSKQFVSGKFHTYDDLKIVQGTSMWHNYMLSAMAGLLEYSLHHKEEDVGATLNARISQTMDLFKNNQVLPKGMKVLVTGNVPVAAGLSSSSSVTVAALQTFIELAGQKKHFDMELIRRLSISAERHCGTASGGMDQTIICLGQKGYATRISFAPLTTTPVHVPSNVRFVVCNSMVKSEKATSAPFQYNKRVMELRTGNLMIVDQLHDRSTAANQAIGPLPVLKTIQETYNLGFTELMTYIQNLKDSYSRAEFEDYLPTKFREKLDYLCGPDVLRLNDTFHPKQRLRHVINEHQRVQKFERACEQAIRMNESVEVVLETLGGLLDDSMASLSGDFDCGSVELKQICEMARSFPRCGGARLTGAGWGGSILAVVAAGQEDNFIDHMIRGYYKPMADKGAIDISPQNVTKHALRENIFATAASAGARSMHNAEGLTKDDMITI